MSENNRPCFRYAALCASLPLKLFAFLRQAGLECRYGLPEQSFRKTMSVPSHYDRVAAN